MVVEQDNYARVVGAVMYDKASISHDAAIVEELRNDPEFAAEYLRAAWEDKAEPSVLPIALRHLAEARENNAPVNPRTQTRSD